jgi:CheY-like chemotaxis protein
MNKTVLLVDDEPDIRFTARFMLETEGYSLLEAATGEQALEMLGETTPDAILLDIRLPGIQGWDVLDHVRNNQPGVPVVMMSAHSSGDTMQRAMDQGSTAYLLKPFKQAELLQVLDDVTS